MQKRIPEHVIENVRKSNDVVDVIGEYVQLKKQGRNFFGLCPFHDENTPSFSVTQEKQIFHCFGCKKGGNVISFLMELEGYSFINALQVLADRAGIELPEIQSNYTSKLSTESQTVLEAYDWLTKLYNHLLKYTKEGKEGYEYFKSRGINDDSIDLFQLGYSPNLKGFTAEFLKKKGFHQQKLIKAGLLNSQDDEHVTDRFRGRVIFPIRNHLGRTVAFGGRAISSEQEPKYLNSSESELFQKSRILYNFDVVKRYIRQTNEVILFEGYMDVITAFQVGIKNVTATLGTSLTESQAKLLNRYVETVVICYDADHAGIEASYQAARLLRHIGCDVKVAQLETGMDPDNYIKEHGAEQFKSKVIDASHTFMSFYMIYLRKGYNLNIESDRIKYIKAVLKQIATIDSSLEREHYLKNLSDDFELSMDTLNAEIHKKHQEMGLYKDKRVKNRYTSRTTNFQRNKQLLPAFHNAERKLIAYMLQDASIADKVQKEIGLRFNIDNHKIIATHLYAFYEEQSNPDVGTFIDHITDKKIKQLVIELAMIPIIDEISENEIEDYIKVIHRQSSVVTNIDLIRQQQKLAEQQNDPIKAAKIAMEIIKIKKQL